MSIEIKGVSKKFGNTTALNNVSTTIENGNIYGLLGNNGAGKSTLLNIITNRLFPDEGEVLIDGKSNLQNDSTLGKIFMMGEQNLYPDDIRVKRVLNITHDFYPDFDLPYAKSISERFGLNQNKKITALSTGYASIFRLVVALSVNAPYILLDEPVLGLDAQHRDMFYRLLLEKYSEGKSTFVISTHLIQEVANMINHTVIIKSGEIIRDMPCEELLADCYTVSGPVALVDEYVGARNVVSENILGGLKTVCMHGKPDGGNIYGGLEIGRMNLQDYFINLMNGGEDAR